LIENVFAEHASILLPSIKANSANTISNQYVLALVHIPAMHFTWAKTPKPSWILILKGPKKQPLKCQKSLNFCSMGKRLGWKI